MKTVIQLPNVRIYAESEFKGDRGPNWAPDNLSRNKIELEIVEAGDSRDMRIASFDFFGSIAKPDISNDYDLGNAVRCILSDALSYEQNNYKEFCSEFGYEPYLECGHCENGDSLAVYEACEHTMSKLEDCGLSVFPDKEKVLCDILNSDKMEEYA